MFCIRLEVNALIPTLSHHGFGVRFGIDGIFADERGINLAHFLAFRAFFGFDANLDFGALHKTLAAVHRVFVQIGAELFGIDDADRFAVGARNGAFAVGAGLIFVAGMAAFTAVVFIGKPVGTDSPTGNLALGFAFGFVGHACAFLADFVGITGFGAAAAVADIVLQIEAAGIAAACRPRLAALRAAARLGFVATHIAGAGLL